MKNSNGESAGTPRSFNLIDEPWIPVVDAEGATFKVGLRELFERSEELVDLAVGTLERITLYRLLICIAQRALNGPKDEDEWLEAEGKIVAASLAYLDEQRDRFDLWGDRPFLQVKELEAVGRTKTDKLDFGLASGNNNTLFDQAATEGGRAHEPDWLARNLLVYLAFSPGSLISVGTINGEKTAEGNKGNAPCLDGCKLFAFVVGKNLRQTVAWNMVAFDQLKYIPKGAGKPFWEFDEPFAANAEADKTAKEFANTWFGRLLPVARFVRLEEDGRNMILTNGVKYLKFKEKEKNKAKAWNNPEMREPMATVIAKKEINEYVSVDPERKPWRQLGAMLVWSGDDNTKVSGPLNLRNLQTLYNEERDEDFFKIWTGGLKNHPLQTAKIIDTASWSVEIPWLYLGDSEDAVDVSCALGRYERGVKLANDAEASLVAAVKEYIDSLCNPQRKGEKEFKIPQKKDKDCKTSLVVQAKNRFWAALERRVDELIAEAAENVAEAAEAKSGLQRWKETLKRELIDAYEKTCACVTARQIRAFAEGKVVLFGLNNKSGDDKNASTDKPKRTKAKK